MYKMSLRVLWTISLMLTATRAVFVDVAPTRLNEALEDTPYALVHIREHKKTEDDEFFERLDIDVYASSDGHPDFPLARSDLFVVVRGIVAPYVGNKSKDMLVYLADRIPAVYEPLKDIPDTSMVLKNGAEEHDAQALDWCIHTPELTCVDTDDGVLSMNGIEWDGTDGDRWLRRQMIPPVIAIDDETLFDLGVRSFDTQLFVFSDDDNVEESILPVAQAYRDDMVTIVGPENHEKAQLLDVDTPGAILVRRNQTSILQKKYNGNLSPDNLKHFISTI